MELHLWDLGFRIEEGGTEGGWEGFGLREGLGWGRGRGVSGKEVWG